MDGADARPAPVPPARSPAASAFMLLAGGWVFQLSPNIRFGPSSVDLLPDFIGFALMATGLSRMGASIRGAQGLERWAWILAGATLMPFLLAILGQPGDRLVEARPLAVRVPESAAWAALGALLAIGEGALGWVLARMTAAAFQVTRPALARNARTLGLAFGLVSLVLAGAVIVFTIQPPPFGIALTMFGVHTTAVVGLALLFRRAAQGRDADVSGAHASLADVSVPPADG